MILRKEANINFTQRYFKMLFDWGSLFLLGLIVFSYLKISIYLSVGIFLLYVIYALNLILEAKIYITQISLNENFFEIQYSKFYSSNNKITIPKKSLEVEWFDSLKGNIRGARLLFFNDKNIVLTQYATGDWDRDKIETLKKELKTIIQP